ncbi:O-antigen ligase family protein [Bradyrhizobium sp. CB3481]|uniref:O-antigen ligase family protein n=1 Tax=Bradyrhizobium sp. CB3481 TaxID=3039158 RepID=UPI0024B16E66|nr:O-antigen ligase family protein [Bradyrhizobium sp. CB3481]WFU18471.1 O-antigen ligase family protein [Bradyrhizobium sp. CB3481]
MTGSALLALGLVLSTASQLRVPGIPLGLGEVFLGLWAGFALMRVLTGDRVSNPGALLRLGAFWMCFAFSLSIGTCQALLLQKLDAGSMLHDVFSYFVVAAISCLIVATMKSESDLRRSQWLLIAFWNVALIIQIALGWRLIRLSSVDPWFWERFRGWSENPNQLALYCALLAALSLYLALSSKGVGRIAALLSCLLSLVVGRLTKSDTFLGAMVLCTAAFLALRLWNWLNSPAHRYSLRSAAAVLMVVAFVPLSLSLVPYALATSDRLGSLAAGMTKDHGGEGTMRTASLRLFLWQNALKLGLESASLGLGPGPHLWRPKIADDDDRPITRPFEAHNTPLDIFTQGGLLGVIAVYGLFAGIFILLLRAKLDALAVLMVALVFFSMAHFIPRHPIVWFAVAVSLMLGLDRAPSPRARTGN